MKVVFSSVGSTARPPNVTVDLSAIPEVGDEVYVWPLDQVPMDCAFVRTVIWNVKFTSDGEPVDEPYVYVVVGQRRHVY